jgi:subtilisin-like proprotein convertase family protein
MKITFLVLSSLLTGLAAVHGQVFHFDFSGVNTAIPDGDPTGLANVQSISSAPNLLVSGLTVNLNITGTGLGGFNGDLYATLQHDSGFTVLLNRPGRRTGSSSGYSDSGMNLTFDDGATRDVHNYRFELNGNNSTALVGPLTGTWSPDARTTDPASVLDSSQRNAFLSSFNGTTVNGTWTLFVTDLSSGATQQINGWGMDIAAVPEPASYAVVTGIALTAFALWRRRKLRGQQ